MFWLVDIFKFIFAIAIVGLHSWFLGSYEEWLYPVVYYSAVPYFFIASGFFFAKKYYVKGYSKEILPKFCKRLFTKLAVFEPISQIQVIILLAIAGTAASAIFLDTVQHIIFYPLGAMWYIQALLVAGCLLVPFIKYHQEKFIIPIGLALYLFALICGRYYFLIEDIPYLKLIVDNYLKYCISPKNGIFIGFLYVGIGVIAAKNWNPITECFKVRRINTFLIISAFLYFSELYLISDYKGLVDGQYYFMQPWFVGSLFLFSAQYYEKPNSAMSQNPTSNFYNTPILRNLSISIYLLHAPVQRCFTLFEEITGIHSKLFGNSYSLFFITLIVTLLICYPIYRKKTKYLYDWLT